MPRARSSPRTRVVFPAPRSPRQVQHAAGPDARGERARRALRVAAASGNLRSTRHGLRRALAQRIKALGARARLPGGGHRRRRSRPRRSRGCSSGSRRDWHGEMEYMARHGALRARPAELKPGTLRVISCRMDYLRCRRRTIVLEARERGLHRPLCPRPRLSQGAARPAAEAVRAHRRRSRRLRLPRVHRFGAGDGGRARRARRHRLARQAHAAPRPRRGLVVLPRRDLHRPAAARRTRR